VVDDDTSTAHLTDDEDDTNSEFSGSNARHDLGSIGSLSPPHHPSCFLKRRRSSDRVSFYGKVRIYRVEKISLEYKHQCYYDAEELDSFRAAYEMGDPGMDFENDDEGGDEELDYHDLVDTYYPYERWESFSDNEDDDNTPDKDVASHGQ
jgi:hypothetical protein